MACPERAVPSCFQGSGLARFAGHTGGRATIIRASIPLGCTTHPDRTMRHASHDPRPSPAQPARHDYMRRVLLALLGGGLLWVAWAGYGQAGLLIQLANLRYCG